MSRFVKVARVEEIGPGEKHIYDVGVTQIVVVNLDGEYYALEDVCTHDGGPLGEGDLAGSTLVCPRHGARFDVRTGEALSMPAFEDAPAYEVRVVDGEILVEVY